MRYIWLTLVLLLFVPMPSMGQTSEQPPVAELQDTVKRQNKFQQIKSNIMQRINDKLNEPYDTTRNSGYWWRAMKHGKVDFNDPTMGYSKFLLFCYKVYNWGDKAFNSYDSAYVVPTGKNWKLTFKNQNWIDNFGGGNETGRAVFTSGAASNVGLYLSFMAVSVGYSLDVDRLFGAKGTSEMMEFSFTCARFTAEFLKTTNTGEMSTRVKYDGSGWRHGDKMKALRRKTMGVNAYYFFNNRKYARAAAYCYSKYQRRSAGSALAGFSVINYDFRVDTLALTPAQFEDFKSMGTAHVRYTDYCLKGGYAHNWVLSRKFLLNLTGLVGGGVKHIHSTEYMPSSNTGALNLSGNFAITFNHKRYFASLKGNVTTCMNFAEGHDFNYTIADFTTVLGIRF